MAEQRNQNQQNPADIDPEQLARQQEQNALDAEFAEDEAARTAEEARRANVSAAQQQQQDNAGQS
jgi:hypothetical protein